jgi:transglutaminase-like putative cysteine protease
MITVILPVIGFLMTGCDDVLDLFLTGEVSISGIPQVGQTLTANTGNLGGSGIISYKWKRGTITIGTDSNTYMVQDADAGFYISVTVSREDKFGSIDSRFVGPVSNSNLPPLTGSVSISGNAQVGQTLTANTGSLGGSGAISYQWKRGNVGIGTNNTYIVQTGDVGFTITVTVTRSGNSGNAISTPVGPVSNSALPPLTGLVSISGTAKVGQTLTANTSSLGGSGAINYQWNRGNDSIGINSNTYSVQAADAGFTITVTVTRAGYYGGIISSPTAVVVPGDNPQSYYYPGTGVTYNGYSGTYGTLTTGSGGVKVTYPAETIFSADGFFTLEGSVNNPACYNYAYIVLTKNSDPDKLKTTYLVGGNFKQRIWLRFGSGSYTVKVYGLSSITFSVEGVYEGLSYWLNPVTFNVTNTRNEGDQRSIYPSYIVQSDDPMILDLAASLTYGLTNSRDKIKAIHDYIVKNTVYDTASVGPSGQRKKQDAISVLGTRYDIDTRYTNGHFLAVCEGYSNAFSALARAAGIEARYVSSNSMNHGWNHVLADGSWKFMDVTWDDPVPDGGPNYVRYNYYLLDNLYGVNNDHTGWVEDNSRSLIGSSTAPWQRGVPDGWY